MSFGYKVAKDVVYYSARPYLKVTYWLLVTSSTSGFKKATGKFINNPKILSEKNFPLLINLSLFLKRCSNYFSIIGEGAGYGLPVYRWSREQPEEKEEECFRMLVIPYNSPTLLLMQIRNIDHSLSYTVAIKW